MGILIGIIGFLLLFGAFSYIVDFIKMIAGFLTIAFFACIAIFICRQIIVDTTNSIVADAKTSIQNDYEDDGELTLISQGKEFIVDILEEKGDD